MTTIIINDKIAINGNLSFIRRVNEDGKSFNVEGILSTHLYFEDIKSIKTSGYILKNVKVIEEDFGSDDYDIVYKFVCLECKDDIVQGINKDGVIYCITPEEMKAIEEIKYKDEHPLLGNIGKEYKDIINRFYKDIKDESENK